MNKTVVHNCCIIIIKLCVRTRLYTCSHFSRVSINYFSGCVLDHIILIKSILFETVMLDVQRAIVVTLKFNQVHKSMITLKRLFYIKTFPGNFL